MKFAKQLEEELVPEWKVKYLNYKAGKKYVKAVGRAVRKANGTPSLRRRSGELRPHPTPSFLSPRRVNWAADVGADAGDEAAGRGSSTSSSGPSSSAARPIPAGRGGRVSGEKTPLTLTGSPAGGEMRYGSIVATPPLADSPPRLARAPSHQPHFELPAPAINYGGAINGSDEASKKRPALRRPFGALQRSFSMQAQVPASSKAHDGSTSPSPPQQQSQEQGERPDAPQHVQTYSYGHGVPRPHGVTDSPKQRLRRLFSTPSPALMRKQSRLMTLAEQHQDEVRQREAEFFQFMDSELNKVETFYRLKEEQAGERLKILREQLHVMRNRRGSEIDALKKKRRQVPQDEGNGGAAGPERKGAGNANGLGSTVKWIEPVSSKIFGPRPGPNSKALQKMARTPRLQAGPDSGADGRGGGDGTHDRRDFARRMPDQDVPYRTAKRKLKLAMQEFYRGLELLKSYALLNRTAFRKLNKKYDKSVNAHPPYAYMNRVVSEAYFVKSGLVDGHIAAVEDLYARYFERGNHKLAVGKLRSLTSRRPGDESGPAFRSGLSIGLGLVLAVQGVVWGVRRMLDLDEDAELRVQTNYLLQIYAGYFLMLYLFVLFCLDCRLWTRKKINYQFIFELDPRSQLDWRQLSQFPSFFMLVLGLFVWLNFSGWADPALYLWYPVLLIAVTGIVLFFPAPVFFYRSRRWFLYSHWRLLLAGLYPVEFRDFFFGDMYCSLTYAMCNVELFFCLYHRAWQQPQLCNSNHSRLMGFFSAVPGIWRALQCIRRYRDTKNVFPHLVNCGKYSMTILAAVTLSVYRINGTPVNLGLFVAFSVVNSMYCSVWDLFMDFSLLQFSAEHRLLRDVVALKPLWVYYVVMVLDPLLRFAWIPYAVFTHGSHHTALVSFMVALAEISRRGMWSIFRVENEHCANVAQYKASRDVPLPYHLETFADPLTGRGDTEHLLADEPAVAGEAAAKVAGGTETLKAKSTGVDVGRDDYASGEPQSTMAVEQEAAAEEGRAGISRRPTGAASGAQEPAQPGSLLRRRLTRADTIIGGISRVMAEAHKQDFEKRRRPTSTAAPPLTSATTMSTSLVEDDDDDAVCFSNDDDDDDDDEDSDIPSPVNEDAFSSPPRPHGSSSASGGSAVAGRNDPDGAGAGAGVGNGGSGAAARGAAGVEPCGPRDEVRSDEERG